jgi:glycogen synthase
MPRPLRIVYAAGPGDVLGSFQHWKDGRAYPAEVSVTYSEQFYEVAQDLGAEVYVISSHGVPGEQREGGFRIEHAPAPFQRRGRHPRGALRYHLGQMYASCRLLYKAWRFNADAIVVAEGTGHWFPLRLAPRRR